MKNRGSLDVKVTLFMIVIVIFLIGLFWIVLINVFNSDPSEVLSSLGGSQPEFKIENSAFKDDGTVSVSVKRNRGEKEISGMVFTFSDGSSIESFERESNLKKLETNSFIFPLQEFERLSLIRSVSISPIFSDTENNSTTIEDTKEFSNEEIIKGLGAKSWWRFENDIKDEVGTSNGVNRGDFLFVDGNSGKAASFDGINDYSEFIDFDTLNNAEEFSISFWIFREEGSSFDSNQGIFISGQESEKSPWIFGYEGTRSIFAQFGTSESVADCSVASRPVNSLRWSNVVFVWDGSSCMFYENSQLTNSDLTRGKNLIDSENRLFIGKMEEDGFFKGFLDDVIVFDRALTESEINIIYNLGA